MASKRGRVYKKIVCSNPNCSINFIQRNPKHRICNKKQCKEWLLQQNKYEPQKYKFTEEFKNKNLNWCYIVKENIDNLTFTRNDFEKVKD